MPDFERRVVGGNFYLRCRETGRRTKLYTSLDACFRAVERGELLTDDEYAVYRGGSVGAAPRRAIKPRKEAA